MTDTGNNGSADTGTGSTNFNSDEHLMHLLTNFSDEQILTNLSQRQAVYVCTCGAVFRDRALFYMHRSCHATGDSQKCSFCGYVAPNWFDFQAHFFDHKSAIGSKS